MNNWAWSGEFEARRMAGRWVISAATQNTSRQDMMKSSLSLNWLIICFLAFPATAADAPPDPNLPYQAQRRNPVTYDVSFSVVFTAPSNTKLLRLWLPMPPSDLGQEVTEGSLTTFPMDVTPHIASEERFGNRFACFDFPNPQGAQIVKHRFQIKIWELDWRIDPDRVSTVRDWPSAFDAYRGSDSQAVVVDGRFERLLAEIVPNPRDPLRDFSTVLDWVSDNFRYDHVNASLRASAIHGLEERRGHCSDYHGFCASMGRVLGCPTRVTYGINTFPKNSPSHCKLEAYLHPSGWVSFDVSETQKLLAAIRADDALDEGSRQTLLDAVYDRLRGGFRDNTWFVQTRGTDYDLAPPASARVPVVRTAYIEADGIPLPEPDPANSERHEFSWMTVHDYVPDRPVDYPFTNYGSLLKAGD